jgi:acetyl-CoA synthetase
VAVTSLTTEAATMRARTSTGPGRGAATTPVAEAPSDAWERARSELTGLPYGAGLNLAYEAVDRHLPTGVADRVALRFLAEDGGATDVSYAELATATNRFANLLTDLGVERGDTVFLLIGRVPELYVAALGGWKVGAVVCPLFSQFGPEPVVQRLRLGKARLLVTTPQLYARKVAWARDELPELRHVLVTGAAADGTRPLAELLAGAADTFTIAPTAPEDPALLHFTSGTTGTPKGAVHVHGAVVGHLATARLVLDLRAGDTYWCTADPGWVTGTSYGIIAPLVAGVTSIVDAAEFDAHRWYDILERERVQVWYTAPTAIRRLMRVGTAEARRHDLSALRRVASVGEPLNPEAVEWGREAFDRTIHDTWWQTETGCMMIANYGDRAVRPGSMGRPVPGIEAAVMVRGEDGRARRVDGHVTVETSPGEIGELALRAGWPSMFRGYLDDEARTAACFSDGWYLTGDLARIDADGYFWFVGRADDVIKSAGHLIGPFEVESALMEHPAVAEAGVIGRPDPLAGEVVKAFVALNPGFEPGEALRRELLGHGRKRLGAVVAPKEIAFSQDLPKTRSGKIMRRLLKARELGLATGDTSTLEQPS